MQPQARTSASIAVLAFFVSFSLCPALMAAGKPTKTPSKITAAKKFPAWDLEQRSRMYGDMRMIVSDFGFKTMHLKSGLTYVSVPPFSEITVFSKKNSKVYTTKISVFRSVVRPISVIGGVSISDAPLMKSGSATVASIKCDRYESPKDYSDKQMKLYKSGYIACSAVAKMKLASAPSLSSSPGVYLAASKMTEVPTTKGVPLQCTYFDMDNDKLPHLVTYSCKPVQLSASEFEIPKGLKSVKNSEEVNVGDGDQDALNLMLESGRTRVEGR